MFFLITVLLVVVIALYMGDFWMRAQSYTVTAYFENVQGLPAGAEVRFAGVKIGRVIAVALGDNPKFPKRPAAVRMSIYRDNRLYQNDDFVIQQGALLGDKYVEVRRSAAMPKVQLAHNGAVAGGESAGIEDLTEQAKSLVKEARAALSAMRSVFVTDYNVQAMKAILTSVIGATGKADQLATQALRLSAILTRNVQQSSPDLLRLAANLAAASESVKSTAQLVRTTLATSPIPRDMTIASGNLRQVSQDVARISDNFAQVLAVPETREKMQAALDNLALATGHLAKITAEAEKLVGDGTMSADLRSALASLRESAASVAHLTKTYDGVLTDPKFTENLQGTMAAARQATEAGARTLEHADTQLERVSRALDRVSKVTETIAPTAVRTRASLQTTRHGGRADFDVDLQYGQDPNNFWRVGVRDIGHGNGLNVQRAIPSGNDRIRAGFFSGQLGIGYDYAPDQRFSVETELWDPRNLHVDIRGSYGLNPNADILFGFNDVGNGTTPFIGGRYKMK